MLMPIQLRSHPTVTNRWDREQGGIRCVYHGWKFDTERNCLDMRMYLRTGCISVEPYITRHCGHPLAPVADTTRDARNRETPRIGEQRAEKTE
jgi:hypothetical protein